MNPDDRPTRSMSPEDGPTRPSPPLPEPDPRWVRWCRRLLVAGGVLIMGYAVAGTLTDPDSRLGGQLIFLGGVLVAHDAVLMPLAIGVGVLVGRLLPVPARTAVRVAAFVSLCVGLVALPVVLGLGRPAGDRSALPLPYGRNLAVVLLAVWAAALVRIGWLYARRRHARRPPT